MKNEHHQRVTFFFNVFTYIDVYYTVCLLTTYITAVVS